MAIAVSGTPAVVDLTLSASGQTASITLSGSDTCVIGVMCWVGAQTYSEMRWGGASGEVMTQLGSTYTFDTDKHIAIAYKVGASTGSYTVYGAASAAPTQFAVGGAAFTGVHQSTPVLNSQYYSATGDDAAATITFASAVDALAIDVLHCLNGAIAPTGGQTALWEIEAVAGERAAASSYEAGASSVTMSYSNEWDIWAMLGFSLSPAAGGASSETLEGTEGASADQARYVKAFRALSVAAADSTPTTPRTVFARRLADATEATSGAVARVLQYLRPLAGTSTTTAVTARLAHLSVSIATAVETATASLDAYIGRTAWLQATADTVVAIARLVSVFRTQATVESAWAFMTKGKTARLDATMLAVVDLSRYAKHYEDQAATVAATAGQLTIQWAMTLAGWAETVASNTWAYVNTRVQSLSATESGGAGVARSVWTQKTEAATSTTTGGNARRRTGVRSQTTVESAFGNVAHRTWAARTLARSYGVTALVARTWTKLTGLDATVTAVVETVRLAFVYRLLDATHAATGLVVGLWGTFNILDATSATTATIERLVLAWRTQDATHEATGAVARMVLAFRTIADALGVLASLSASAPRAIVLTAQAVMAATTERLVAAWRTLADASLLIVADLTTPTSGYQIMAIAGDAASVATLQPRTRIFRSLDYVEVTSARTVTRWGVLAFHRPTTAHHGKKRRTAEEP